MARIRISWQSADVSAVLKDTPTARKLLAALPCDATANTWGEEVYFSLPVTAALEADAQQVVEPGTVCFWVDGNSLALPFGPTPVSKGTECRLVTRCNVLGKIEGDPRRLNGVRDGARLRIEAISE